MKPTSHLRKWRGTAHVFAAIAALTTLMGIAPVRAAAQSLALAPAQLQYQFKPGQPFQYDISVSNKGAAPVWMRISATDFWYNDKNEKLFNAAGSSPRSAANWIEFIPRQLTVAAESTATVEVIVTPPLQVSGGYYAVVFAESRPELAEVGAPGRKPVYTNMRLGSLVLLSAANTEEYGVEVSDTQFTPPATDRPMKFDFLLTNKSNTHIFPKPEVAILSSTHELIARAEGVPKRFLPQQKDRLSVTWAGTLAPGNYTAILTIPYAQDKIYTQEFPFSIAALRSETIAHNTAP